MLIVDMLPHDRVEYQQQMGHVWLGFAEEQITQDADGRGLRPTSRRRAAARRAGRQGPGAVRRAVANKTPKSTEERIAIANVNT